MTGPNPGTHHHLAQVGPAGYQAPKENRNDRPVSVVAVASTSDDAFQSLVGQTRMARGRVPSAVTE